MKQAPAGYFQGVYLSQDCSESDNVLNNNFVKNHIEVSKIQKTKTENSIWHRLAPKFKELVDMFDDNTDESVILRFENLIDNPQRNELWNIFQCKDKVKVKIVIIQ